MWPGDKHLQRPCQPLGGLSVEQEEVPRLGRARLGKPTEPRRRHRCPFLGVGVARAGAPAGCRPPAAERAALVT